jgi:hypothetical protein
VFYLALVHNNIHYDPDWILYSPTFGRAESIANLITLIMLRSKNTILVLKRRKNIVGINTRVTIEKSGRTRQILMAGHTQTQKTSFGIIKIIT